MISKKLAVLLSIIMLFCFSHISFADGLNFGIISAIEKKIDELRGVEYQPPEINQRMDLWDVETGPHLRGAHIHQRRVYPELDGPNYMGPGILGPPYTQEDFNRLASWGANVVNISHPGLFTETSPYVLDEEVQDNLDRLVEMGVMANMFVVITFRTGPGRSESIFSGDEAGTYFGKGYVKFSEQYYYNDEVWQDQAAQDAWVKMWRYTAERYRDNPAVVGYQLMGEPNGNDVWLDIYDPYVFYPEYEGSLYDWNQFYPRIVDAIRQVDSLTPVLVGGMNYSEVEWLSYLKVIDDPRTVYIIHQWEPYFYTHQQSPLISSYPGMVDVDWDGMDEIFNREWLENYLEEIDEFARKYGVPVAVNEFGAMRWEPGAAEFIDDQLELFERWGMNHGIWAWEGSWDPYVRVVDAFNFRHGPDPNNHTDVTSSDLIEVIKKYWARNTIRPADMSWD